MYEKDFGQELTKDNAGRLKLRKVADLGLEMSSKKIIEGQRAQAAGRWGQAYRG